MTCLARQARDLYHCSSEILKAPLVLIQISSQMQWVGRRDSPHWLRSSKPPSQHLLNCALQSIVPANHYILMPCSDTMRTSYCEKGMVLFGQPSGD